MKFSLSLAILTLALWSTVSAYSVKGASVTLNKKEYKFDLQDSRIPKLTLESPKDTLYFSLDGDGDKPPRQMMYLFSDTHGLDHAEFATFGKTKPGVVVDISVNKLPDALKRADRIRVSFLAVSAEEDEPNLNQVLVDLIPGPALKESVQNVKPVRLGALPEIHHVFRAEEGTVNGVIPVAFSGLAVALFVVLLGAWTSVLKDELFASVQGSTWKAALLSTLAYAEYTFLQYYLGASVFTTAFHVLLLAGPFLFFGSRALSVLGKLRASGKA